MELSDYLRILRAHWIGVLVFLLLGLIVAGGYTFTQPKIYAANANGFVNVAGVKVNATVGAVNDTLAKSRATSYVDIATSRATAERVIEDLGLDTTPSALIDDISVNQPLDTVLLKITAKSTSPKEAQELADAWVRALAAQVKSIENPDGDDPNAVEVVPVEAAALPSSPISPNPPRNLAIGGVLGLLLGFAYAVIRSRLDRRLRSNSDIDKQFGVPVVGRVPAIKALQTGDHDRSAILSVSKASGTAGWEPGEAFRKLRTSIAYMDVDNPPRVIVVTSPQPNDGKSTVSANLAAAIAISGQRVTLVDGDLRRPSVAKGFGLVEGAGLTDVLIGRVELADVIQDSPDFEGLSVLAAGSIPPNPSELLGSRAMHALIEEIARDGMVIIDAPPLLPVTDAAVITRECDGAIVVISHARTVDQELDDALNSLRAVQGRILGVTINRVPRRESGSGYYYTGYYTEDNAAADAAKRRSSRISKSRR